MNLKLYYRMRVHDPDGSLVKDTGLVPSHSYVIQFLELVKAFLDGVNVTATDVNGDERPLYEAGRLATDIGNVKAPALTAAYGIVVGTNDGATAEDNENYKLDTKILHDATGAAGKMNYRDVTFVAPREVGPNVDLDVFRPFINETASTITVKEIGIIIRKEYNPYYHLILRDVVTDEDVLAGYTLTVVYTLRTTV